MNRHMEGVFALIGHYVVISIIAAGSLMLVGHDVPFWCAFPLTTIWMILRGQLRGNPPARTVNADKDHDIDTHV